MLFRSSDSYKQLGNGVSVGAVYYVLRQAVAQYEEYLKASAPGLVRSVLDSAPSPDKLI